MAPSKEDNRIAIDFIDPLFAVVLNVSFAQVYLEPWFADFRLVFQEPHKFHVATLSLGYLTVIQSWIGYHRSIRTRWINVHALEGRFRFFLDVLVLMGICGCDTIAEERCWLTYHFKLGSK
jgi:hypothetical protein